MKQSPTLNVDGIRTPISSRRPVSLCEFGGGNRRSIDVQLLTLDPRGARWTAEKGRAVLGRGDGDLRDD